MKTEDIIKEREKTHGNFEEVAFVHDGMMDCLNHSSNVLSCAKRLAISNICLKLARIVCGNSNFSDHWDDIAGYAMLGKGENKADALFKKEWFKTESCDHNNEQATKDKICYAQRLSIIYSNFCEETKECRCQKCMPKCLECGEDNGPWKYIVPRETQGGQSASNNIYCGIDFHKLFGDKADEFMSVFMICQLRELSPAFDKFMEDNPEYDQYHQSTDTKD